MAGGEGEVAELGHRTRGRQKEGDEQPGKPKGLQTRGSQRFLAALHLQKPSLLWFEASSSSREQRGGFCPVAREQDRLAGRGGLLP